MRVGLTTGLGGLPLPFLGVGINVWFFGVSDSSAGRAGTRARLRHSRGLDLAIPGHSLLRGRFREPVGRACLGHCVVGRLRGQPQRVVRPHGPTGQSDTWVEREATWSTLPIVTRPVGQDRFERTDRSCTAVKLHAARLIAVERARRRPSRVNDVKAKGPETYVFGPFAYDCFGVDGT